MVSDAVRVLLTLTVSQRYTLCKCKVPIILILSPARLLQPSLRGLCFHFYPFTSSHPASPTGSSNSRWLTPNAAFPSNQFPLLHLSHIWQQQHHEPNLPALPSPGAPHIRGSQCVLVRGGCSPHTHISPPCPHFPPITSF